MSETYVWKQDEGQRKMRRGGRWGGGEWGGGGVGCGFFFNDTATTEIYTLSLHDALPIWILPPLKPVLPSVIGLC